MHRTVPPNDMLNPMKPMVPSLERQNHFAVVDVGEVFQHGGAGIRLALSHAAVAPRELADTTGMSTTEDTHDRFTEQHVLRTSAMGRLIGNDMVHQYRYGIQ